MYATLSPVTREFSQQHFEAALARIEADELSDRMEIEYLLSTGGEPDFEALDALADSLSERCDDCVKLLQEVIDARYDII